MTSISISGVLADRTQRALVHGGRAPWIASPEARVERRMLERSGGEIAVATSIVRYRPDSRFREHMHAMGEEFLVLDGTFSDEHGHYPVGTYVRNPPGSSHAPFSTDGCIIFVKLRQMVADEHARVRVFPESRAWKRGSGRGHEQTLLYSNGRVAVSLERLDPGASIAERAVPRGEEILVVEGRIELLVENAPTLETWSWLRHPGDTHPAIATGSGALLWIKRGHLV